LLSIGRQTWIWGCKSDKITNEVFALRTAAIGIGSNSLRMLIANVGEGKLERLGRYREGLRVFAALDEQGNISAQMLTQAADSIEAFAKEAVGKKADMIHLFATSAVRDAKNAAMLEKVIFDRTGLLLEVCSGDEEAELSFLGATRGVPSGMIDIGGGSTEIVVGNSQSIQHAISLQMGAVRLFRMLPVASEADARRVIDYAHTLLAPHLESYRTFPAEEWIGVGGTFTTSAAFVQRKPWDDRTNIHGFPLTREHVMDAIRMLAPMSVDERKMLPFLQPQRADIIVHGLAILAACMEAFQLEKITVSEYGNLEGYLKKHYLYK